MKLTALLVSTSICLGSSVYGQVGPSATAPGNPLHGLQYAFRYSQTARFSDQYSTSQTSNASASAAYTSKSVSTPFSMDYVGGYRWILSGKDYGDGGQFHHMYLSQGFVGRRWNFQVYDNVAYLPQSPTTGFSGIPGIGEVIGVQNPVTSTNSSILVVSTHVLTNEVSGQLDHRLNYATSLGITGGAFLINFPDGNGIDSRAETGTASLSRRLNARTSLVGRYGYTQYQYSGTTVSMHTNRAQMGIERRLTRSWVVRGYGGPEWINSTITTIIPNKVSYAAQAGMSYTQRYNSFDVNYSHGTNSGSGYIVGGTVDSAQGDFFRQIQQNLSAGLTFGYQRTSSLSNSGATTAIYGGSQANWRVGQSMVVFANYTGTSQLPASNLPSNVLNTTIHTISFGFGISPREPHGRP